MPTPLPRFSLSRRRVVAGGLALACWTVPGRAQGPEPAPDGFRVLRARTGEARLRGPDGPATPIWGFDGVAPGPTLRVRRGEELRVRVVNDLAAPMAVHWHGVRGPNGMDGVAGLTQPPIAPGASFEYRLRPPDAGTFWYRSEIAAANAAHQLSGVLLVEEPDPVEVDRDVILLIEQWENDKATPHLTTNGAPRLDIAVRTHERVRLRLINATRVRTLALRLDGLAARVMAIDGQPAEPFLARDSRITLGPGNRADLFVDVTLAAGASVPIRVGNAADAIPIARLVCGPEAARAAPRPEPKPLPPNPLPERLDLRAALRQEIPLDALATAVGPVHERPPVLRVRRGRTVVLTVKNQGETGGVVHLHGHSARLLDRLDDGWKPFWLDTLIVGGRQTERIAFLADNPGRWALEGRFLGTDKVFASWFEVT